MIPSEDKDFFPWFPLTYIYSYLESKKKIKKGENTILIIFPL